MTSSRLSSMLAATAIALSGGAFTAASANQTVDATPGTNLIQGSKQAPGTGMSLTQAMQVIRGMYGGAVRTRRYPRPGYSVKQGQRMARKASNKARNRRAHR